MDNKKWLVEVVMAACLIAAAIVAFFLMGGRALWTSMVHK
jgi:hypothetical protein